MLSRFTLSNPQPEEPTENKPSGSAQVWIFRWVVLMTVLTLFLMAVGSATRVMEAGLACPDWPLCFGELIPQRQMNLQVFLEWFHRLVATSLGLFTIGLTAAAWWWRKALPQGFTWVASFALVLVIAQGILGGLTVTELLRFEIVTAHLGTGLLFFCVLIKMAVFLSPYQGTGTAGNLTAWGLVAGLLIYGQSILGGLVSSQWALHQCLYGDRLCSIMNSHLIGVVPATLSVIAVLVVAWRRAALHPLLRRLTQAICLALVLQLLLGSATYQLKLQVPALTVAHQMIGATLLGLLVAFTTLAWRDNHSELTSA
ncbi:COX15/CtaA family protein [Candidatus Synechococcus calcipolaris G9]|uniref:COX15/CtaA family protein n=1 Tax=Candidatus Synechococcus calcipolaris G9 TaxID=1497997 RepID=A0ABT6EZK0_9SYNE|nr:COX15/CtaA family protein [Candidatus Synechococcus calcipolaris]MDG2991011.1 COX15/CtaA family protein [Candidatus Synechococcus calcipolaris G9]